MRKTIPPKIQPTDVSVMNSFEDAMTAIRGNEMDRARRILSQIVQSNPMHTDAHATLGALLLDRGEDDVAHEVLMRAIAFAPENNRIQLLLGRLGISRSKEGRHEEAIAVFDRVVSLHPQDAGALSDLGMAALGAGKRAEARKCFLRAQELSIGCAQAHAGLGLVYAQERNWAEAVRELRVAARLAPSSEAIHYDLGLASEAVGDREQARVSFLRAAALSPDDAEIASALHRTLDPNHYTSTNTETNNSITGDVQLFPLTNLLEFLRMQTKSGTLTVATPLGIGVLELQEGRLVSASSPHAKRLGQMLLEEKLLTREQFDRALFEQTSAAADTGSSAYFGAIVLAHDWMSKERLGEVVLDQIMTALNEILSWEQGTFSFQTHEGRTTQAPLTFDLQYTILELFRRRDENRIAAERRPTGRK